MKEEITLSWIEAEIAKVNMAIDGHGATYHTIEIHKCLAALELAKAKLEQCEK